MNVLPRAAGQIVLPAWDWVSESISCLGLYNLLDATPLEVDEGLHEGVGDQPLPLLGALDDILAEVVEDQVLRAHLSLAATTLRM